MVASAIAHRGQIGANGGTLTVAGTVTAGGTLKADTSNTLVLNGTSSAVCAVLNTGTLTLGANASLHVTASVSSASTGLFVLTNASLLEVAGDTAASSKISFLGTSGDMLMVDFASQFGTNVELGTYTGPKLANFGTLDTIGLRDLAFSGATIDGYTAATGLLQLYSGGTKATLLFDNATLGSGTFQVSADSSTGTMVIRS